jgi:hypothetical protein
MFGAMRRVVVRPVTLVALGVAAVGLLIFR